MAGGETWGTISASKELLRLFLKPFLECFFPHIAGRLDLSIPEFVDKELFEDPHEGGHRVADLVARVATRDGEPEMLLVHVEVQADRRGDVPARMFDYYALLRRTYRLPVIRSRFVTTVWCWPSSMPKSTPRGAKLSSRDWPL